MLLGGIFPWSLVWYRWRLGCFLASDFWLLRVVSRLGGHGCGWVTGARHVPAEVVGEVGGRVGAERHGAGGGLEGAEVEAAVDVEDLAGGVIEQAVGDGADGFGDVGTFAHAALGEQAVGDFLLVD